ncbi:hypothetical protein V8G54_004477 [Vigna mungo]|uniref:Uncharacterized protein n=1 Tax=Vigna mungo TaxID=3915 RepID=A0AAQ3PCN2_VIGMU
MRQSLPSPSFHRPRASPTTPTTSNQAAQTSSSFSHAREKSRLSLRRHRHELGSSPPMPSLITVSPTINRRRPLSLLRMFDTPCRHLLLRLSASIRRTSSSYYSRLALLWTPRESTIPLEQKRKSKEGDKSSSKCSRREGSVSHPLRAGVFDPEFNAGSRVNLYSSSSQRAVIEPLSKEELLSASLVEEKKVSDSQCSQLEALALDHEGCAERQSGLQANLDEVRHQLATTNESLTITRTRGDNLAEVVSKLKVEVRRLGKRGDELAGQNERLSKELLVANAEKARLASKLVKANDIITTLDEHVNIEHKEGFNKATRQTTFLLKVDPIAVGFDMDQDVFSEETRPVMKAKDAEDVEDIEGGEGVKTDKDDVGEDETRNNEFSQCLRYRPIRIPFAVVVLVGTRRSPSGKVDSGSLLVLSVHQLVIFGHQWFSWERAVHRPPKLIVVPFGTLCSLT